MINFRYVMTFIVLFCASVVQADGIEIENKSFRNFWHPTYNGERLDYCTLDGKECGKSVANRYCQMLGYDYSNQHIIAHNLGLTHYLSTRARCKGWRCNGFMTIGCVAATAHVPPRSYHFREKKFVAPRFQDFRVDWCYNQKEGCGVRAANAFCSRIGFMRAVRFAKENHIGATKTIGSQELCFGKHCEAFKEIVCYR